MSSSGTHGREPKTWEVHWELPELELRSSMEFRSSMHGVEFNKCLYTVT